MISNRLDEFSKEEWQDVSRKLRPDWTDEQFEEAWVEFQEMKRRKAQQ
jgi:hypothetical protein